MNKKKLSQYMKKKVGGRKKKVRSPNFFGYIIDISKKKVRAGLAPLETNSITNPSLFYF